MDSDGGPAVSSFKHADDLGALGGIDRGGGGRIGKSYVENLADPVVFADGGEEQAIARHVNAGAEIFKRVDRADAAADVHLCGDLGAFPAAPVSACHDRLRRGGSGFCRVRRIHRSMSLIQEEREQTGAEHRRRRFTLNLFINGLRRASHSTSVTEGNFSERLWMNLQSVMFAGNWIAALGGSDEGGDIELGAVRGALGRRRGH